MQTDLRLREGLVEKKKKKKKKKKPARRRRDGESIRSLTVAALRGTEQEARRYRLGL